MTEPSRLITVFLTREDTEKKVARLSPRKYVGAVRAALVNAGGVTYPAFQPVSEWNDFDYDSEQDRLVFRLDRKEPRAEFILYADGSFEANRNLRSDEASGAALVPLEALAWEFCLTALFGHNLVKALKLGPADFRIGFTLHGMEGAIVDWSGFSPAPDDPKSLALWGEMSLWRLRPFGGGPDATFDESGVTLPATTRKALVTKVANVIEAASYCVVAHPSRVDPGSQPVQGHRLSLERKSIEAVCSAALERARFDIK